MEYYTYAFLREDKTPYYIGKGKGNRAYGRRYKGIKPPKDKSRILILKKNLTEEEAIKHEIYMIALFGRKDLDTGILHNRTDGGDGTSGRIVNEETRRKMSEAQKGENNPNYGKRQSEEHKRKISEGNKNPSEEKRKKMSVALRGENNPMYNKTHSKEWKRNKSESMRGENNPNYGKSPSIETRKKMSEKTKGENNPNYGKRWWNDGNGNTKLSKECPGENWCLGRNKTKGHLTNWHNRSPNPHQMPYNTFIHTTTTN